MIDAWYLEFAVLAYVPHIKGADQDGAAPPVARRRAAAVFADSLRSIYRPIRRSLFWSRGGRYVLAPVRVASIQGQIALTGKRK